MGDVLVPCKKCGNKVPSTSLKLDLDIRMMICPDCIKNKKIHKEIEKEAFHKPDMNQMTSPQPQKKVEEEKALKSNHKCQSCDYVFKVNYDTKTPKNCPYCGSRILGF
ncbi:MAG TPA: hypothetical protein VJI97_04175 [Candidatus Nanoarchaeia archaeon]|nr:hypothetical protein [Candidatus Nanoarchaeia archaeon]